MRRKLMILIGILALVGAFAAAWRYDAIASQRIPDVPVLPAPTAPDLIKIRETEPTFGHPMVRGGIHTYAELVQNAKKYIGFDLEHAHFTTLNHSRFAYVSYQVAGVVFWTKKPRFIKAGEPIITDGHFIILQRCGNMLSDEPVPDTLPNEPLDIYPQAPPDDQAPVPTPVEYTPVAPPLVFTPVNLTPPSVATAPPSTFLTPLVPVSFTPTTPIVPVPPVPTPEPATGFLVLTSILAFVLVKLCLW